MNPLLSFNLGFAKAVTVNTAQGFDYPRDTGKNVYFTGWMGSIGKGGSPVKEFCGDSPSIYLSLGSMPQMSRHHAKMIVQGVSHARTEFSYMAAEACDGEPQDDCDRLQKLSSLKAVWVVPSSQIGALPKLLPKFMRAQTRRGGETDYGYLTSGPEFVATISHCGLEAAQSR